MLKRRLLANKVLAFAMIVLGVASIEVLGDATAAIFLWMVATPLIFAKRNWTSL